jgi:tRNA U34 5-methylaminomethyl-2-thiouridine-forming methyltransferase MnmC
MALKIIETADGSTSFYNEELDETYHSRHGAIQESSHVFIGAGLLTVAELQKEISILEMGFGTGLNAWLTAVKAVELELKIKYTTLEAFPISNEQVNKMNYSDWGKGETQKLIFSKIQEVPWEESSEIDQHFSIKKIKRKFENYHAVEEFDLIYFDAFGPDIQPELWSDVIFRNMFKALKPGGILVTYSVNGSARRAMKSAGFIVEKIPGPPGKREMSRAVKVNSE